MMVVIIILGVISSIAYPMLFMNQKITTQQIKESAKRNDIRSIESFLKDDLRNCKNVVESGPPETYEYKINLNSTEEILYKRLQDDQGRYYISRQRGTEVIDFKDIVDIDLEKEPRNNNLYNAQITSTDDKGDPYLHELKIARWDWEVKKNTTLPFYSFLLDENLFVFGAGFSVAGNLVNALDSTIFITGDISSSDMNGGADLRISNIIVDGDFTIGAGHSIGVNWEDEEVDPGYINVSGDLNVGGGANVYGNIYVHGDLNHTNGTIYAEKIIVAGDAYLSGGATINGELYVLGNLNLTTGTLEDNAYVNKNVSVSDGFSFKKVSSKVYYLGNVSYLNQYYDYKNRFIKEMVISFPQLMPIPNVEIPTPRDTSWYSTKGYIENGYLDDNVKIISTNTLNRSTTNEDAKNMIIVSLEGDINLSSNWNEMSGLLYAPQGKITLNGISSFEGIAIAKNGVFYPTGGSEFVFIDIKDLIPDENDFPFLN